MADTLLPVADARHLVHSTIKPVEAEHIKLRHALGRVIAENSVARVSHPPADLAAMDGYAIRTSDLVSLPTKINIVGESAAGQPWKGKLNSGECIRIFTGAIVPETADAVVIQENTTAENGLVQINRPLIKGKNIRARAQDFYKGEAILKYPHMLNARDIGLLAAMNLPEVKVYRRPRIGVLSTGNEILQPGETISEGQIFSANGPGLCAFIESKGAQAFNLGIVPDNLSKLRDAIKRSGELDMLVSSGGVSVGDHDLVKRAAIEEGLQIYFHKIAMRPGKPLLYGTLKNMPFFGLPGNPVSAMVCAVIFLGPAIAMLSGLPGDAPESLTARLSNDIAANNDREHYIRAVLQRSESGLPTVTSLTNQDSALIKLLSEANALICHAPHAEALSNGSPVRVIPLT
ncbi:MAG: molybdopterin molybdenumtransferase MoeA [Candidatus Marinimicrobia bacterium]|nr:molybdopterin molybdenumtransferase MoeA [Candidatus Neomarinimicrobiota bacterium]